jgi:hypothetical protein
VPFARTRPQHLELGQQVKAISYCHDTYRVTTVDGKTRAFWERNLRLKTDSSKVVRKMARRPSCRRE